MKRTMKEQNGPKGARFVVAGSVVAVLAAGVALSAEPANTIAVKVTDKQEVTKVAWTAPHWRIYLTTTTTEAPEPVTEYVPPVTVKKTKKLEASNGDTTSSNYDGSMPKGCIAKYESGGTTDEAGNYQDPGGGKYQIISSTWDGYGGYARAEDAPPNIQEAKAEALWSESHHHWDAQASRCGF